mmetsp:Transcript_22767/g.53774  ORF Transcript_22767/g.53774 Transcript_22767/m.53774 type:complete len:251 (+) Transcript_22767:168-920(+)
MGEIPLSPEKARGSRTLRSSIHAIRSPTNRCPIPNPSLSLSLWMDSTPSPPWVQNRGQLGQTPEKVPMEVPPGCVWTSRDALIPALAQDRSRSSIRALGMAGHRIGPLRVASLFKSAPSVKNGSLQANRSNSSSSVREDRSVVRGSLSAQHQFMGTRTVVIPRAASRWKSVSMSTKEVRWAAKTSMACFTLPPLVSSGSIRFRKRSVSLCHFGPVIDPTCSGGRHAAILSASSRNPGVATSMELCGPAKK